MGRFLSAALLAVTIAAARVAHYDGPPIKHTGGFGEPTCQACHQGAPLNAPGGSLRLEGLPQGAGTGYEPGRVYELRVVLRRPDMGRAGFELSARVSASTQAGELAARDTRVRVVPDSVTHVQYAEQTRDGCSVTGAEARWTLVWRTPARSLGDVLIHVTANAANYDDSPLGDFIYAGEWRVHASR